MKNFNAQKSIFLFNNISFLLSIGITFWMGFLLIASCILFSINVSISNASVWILNILFVFFYSILLIKTEKLVLRQLLYFWIIFIFIIVISGILVSYFYDFSYDGQSYHGVAAYHLFHGWNLFKSYLPYEGTNLYINHYCQGAWIVYACFYKMINYFEFAKITNLLFMLSTLGIVYKLLSEIKIKTILNIISSTLIAFHPVGLNMFLGMYIDGQMAATITLSIVTLILLYLYPNKLIYKLLLFLVLIYLINIKFTGLVFVCYFLGCFGIWAILQKRFILQIRNILIGGLAVLIGVFFIGYSSYVKNVLDFQNPFYPLDVSKSAKGVLSMEPNSFKQQNRILNFIEATFAKTGYSNYYDNAIEYKYPFMVELKELERYAFSGVMIGGMGVWFSGILILSIALLIISWIADKNPQRKIFFLYLFFIISGSCFLLEAPWWARYAPQLYLIPFIALLYFHLVFPMKLKIIYVMLCLLIVNSLLIVVPYTYYNFIVTQKQKHQFQNLKNTRQKYAVDFKNSEVQKVHFEQYNIPYQEVSSSQFKIVPDTLFRSEAVYTPIQNVR